MAVIDRSNSNSSIIVSDKTYVRKFEESGFDFIAEHSDTKSSKELAAFVGMFGNGRTYIREDDDEEIRYF